jgi:hypothetical protein
MQDALPRLVTAALLAHDKDVGAHRDQLKTAVDRLRLPLWGFVVGTGVAGGMLLQRLLPILQ